MRAAAPLLLALFLGSAAPVRAGGPALSGRVVDRAGEAAPGVRIALLPVLPPRQQAALELEGRALPDAVATTTTDDLGRYTLEAPAAGFWRLVARAAGIAARELSFAREPLLEATVLPTLELSATRLLEVTVRDPGGPPASRAWVLASVEDGPLRWRGEPRWDWHLPPATTDAHGRLLLAVPEEAEIELLATHPEHVASAEVRTRGRAAHLALAAGAPRTLRVSDAAGKPLPGVALKIGGAVRPAATTTDRKGRATVTGTVDGLGLHLVLADGRIVQVRLTESEGLDGKPFRFDVPDALTLAGRVVAREGRRPIAGALVYPLHAPGRHVSADRSGRFSLAVENRAGLEIGGAAVGYLAESIRRRPGQAEPLLVLQPCGDLPGFVENGRGDPLAGVEIIAEPHAEGPREVGNSLRYPIRRAVSDDDGNFLLRRLPTEVSYLVTGRLAGFAAAEEAGHDLSASAAAGGVFLALGSGTTVAGVVIDSRSRPVAGATLHLGREFDETNRIAMAARSRESDGSFDGTTDGEGRFELSSVPAGRFQLEIRAPGFATEIVSAIEIEPAESVDLGLIELPAGFELTGTVVDPDGGPIARASVRFQATPTGIRRSSPDELQFTTSDGRFAIADRREGELLDLLVERDGFVDKRVPRVAVPSAEALEIELEPAVTVRGTVEGTDGEPIPGAYVAVAREGGSGTPGRPFVIPLAAGTTDEAGRFALENVEPTVVRLSAEAAGWLPTEVGGIALAIGQEQEEYELELERGATIEGRVIRSDGTPAMGAAVEVKRERGTSRLSPTLGRTTTGGDGGYRLSGVEPGNRLISAYSENGQRAAEQLDVKSGVNRLDFVMPAGVEVSGRVLTRDGQPVAGALVSLRARGGYSHFERSREDGAFRIDDVQPNQLTVTVEHSDYPTTSLPEPIEVADYPVLGLEIRLGGGSDLVGRVTGLGETDLIGLGVTAFQRASSIWERGIVDREGGYRVRDLSAGPWEVFAQSASGQSVTGSIEILPGETTAVLDLEFDDGLVLTGRLLKRGSPVGGALVSAGGLDTSSNGWSETDHEGRFKLSGLEAGRYRLRVSDFRTALSHAEEIALERDDDIVIDLDGLAVGGTVTSERGGGPLPGAVVSLEELASNADPTWRRVGKTATSDANGRYSLSEVPEGSYRLRVSKSEFGTRTLSVEVGDAFDLESVDVALAPVEGVTLRLSSEAVPGVTAVTFAVLDALGGVVASGREPATSDGLVRLASVPDGDWTLVVRGGASATRSLPARAPAEEIAVRLDAAARLTVRVSELVEDASTAATLRLRTPTGQGFKSVRWGGGSPTESWRLFRGETTLEDVPVGRWIVTVDGTDGRSWERTVNLAAGLNDPVTFD